MDPVIILLRLLVPLSIFHYPFAGGIISMWLDGIDWSVNIFNLPNLHANYVVLDKLLNLYYLSIEAYVLLKWKSVLAKKIAFGLYAIRALGIVLFAFIGKEYLLFIFPNIFENFFLFYLAVKFILRKEVKLTASTLWISVLVIAIPKMVQEYVMHVQLVNNWRPVQVPGTPFIYDNLYGQLLIVAVLIFAVCYIQKKKPV